MNGVNVQAAYTNSKLRISQNNYDYKDEVIVSLWEELRKMLEVVKTYKDSAVKSRKEFDLQLAKVTYQVQILESRDWYATEHSPHPDEAGQAITSVMESKLSGSLTGMSTFPDSMSDLTHTSRDTND